MGSGRWAERPHPPLAAAPSPTRRGGRLALVKVACYLLAPLVFWLIPTARIESGPSFCVIRRIFGVPCPGCGMTRALSCAVHGHPRRALAYNNRVAIVLPLLIVAWARGLRAEWRTFETDRMSSITTDQPTPERSR
jgi:hypothetical protein